jgi:hypothetical protein
VQAVDITGPCKQRSSQATYTLLLLLLLGQLLLLLLLLLQF